jgi:hypothetical protein
MGESAHSGNITLVHVAPRNGSDENLWYYLLQILVEKSKMMLVLNVHTFIASAKIDFATSICYILYKRLFDTEYYDQSSMNHRVLLFSYSFPV